HQRLLLHSVPGTDSDFEPVADWVWHRVVRRGRSAERQRPVAQRHLQAARRAPARYSGRVTPAMRLLLADRVRRTNRWVLLFFAAFAGGMWWAAGYSAQPSRALAASMGIAVQLGSFMTLLLIPRALWYLPVSRRDVW